MSWRRAVFLVAAPAALFAQSAEERAIAYLSREVPRWSKENGCFSCHNNGDAARALFAAAGRGWKVDRGALADTLAWLATPEQWEAQRGDPERSDKKLARIQFAAAMDEAVKAGLAERRPHGLRDLQDADGAWRTDGAEAAAGSPATYGLALATALALRVAEAGGDREAAALARKWFLAFQPRSLLDAAAVALAVEGSRRDAALDLLRRGQNADGGWGPYKGSPSEVFDTAAALLALASAGPRESVERGRQYLARTQLENGGWPETTRPAGGQSYAQHVSTSGWALLALVETASR